MKGIIYKITFNEKIYIGSTIQKLKRRVRANHRAFMKYKFIQSESSVEILEERVINDKNELFALEGEHMKKYNCVNQRKARGLSNSEGMREYYKENSEELKKSAIQYYYKNHDENKEKRMKKYKYICSWGGDPRYSNNLLSIKI